MKYDYLIVDGSNMAWRAGSVMQLRSEQGKPVSVSFGMLSMIRSLLEDHQPKMVCVCWDQGGSQMKKDFYPDYKKNRTKSGLPEEFVKEIISQMNELYTMLPYFGIRQLRRLGVEADDLIGALCRGLEKGLVVSSDRDMLQAISLGADVFLTPKNIIVNKLNFKEVTGGVNPEDWVFYRSITGDQGDGIPGLKGFGPVTAKKLIDQHGVWLDWFLTEGVGVTPKLKDEVLNGLNIRQKEIILTFNSLEILLRNYQLMDIGGSFTDEEIKEIANDFLSQKNQFSEDKIKEYFFENQFSSFLARFHGWTHSFRRLQ